MTDTANSADQPETEAQVDAQDNVDISEAAIAAEQAEQDPVVAAEAIAQENWDKYLRAVAELDNVRKRAQRDVEHAHKFANERLVSELLAVSDSLEAALAAGSDASAESLLEGSEATLKIMLGVLQKFGVEQVDPTGAPFDPQVHEAMTMVPSPDAEPNSVIEVIQKGYTLNGRLIRAARVVVAADAS